MSTENEPRGGWARRRAFVVGGVAAAGLLVIGAPVTALGLAGTFSSPAQVTPRDNAPMKKIT